jgi:hypothetical protein
VTTFIVESYVPASVASLFDTEMRRIARALAGGDEIQHLCSIFVPQDETCFHLLEGPSADVVSEAAQEAALRFERVVEAVQLDWEEADDLSRPVGEMAVDIAGAIRFGCGHLRWGEGEEELLRNADLHVRIAHRELVGTLSPLEAPGPAGPDEAAA